MRFLSTLSVAIIFSSIYYVYSYPQSQSKAGNYASRPEGSATRRPTQISWPPNSYPIISPTSTPSPDILFVDQIKSTNHHEPPPGTEDKPYTIITVRLLLHRLIWQTVQMEVHVTLKEDWEDRRLKIDTSKPFELTKTDDLHIWEPDTYISNGEENPLSSKSKITLEDSGHIRSHKMRIVKIPIKDESRFPFVNRKKFVLRLSSYKYSRSAVAYSWPPRDSWASLPPVDLTEQLKNSRYKFENYTAQECISSVVNSSTDAHSCIEVILTFVGPTKQGIFKVFFPSVLLVFASWLHFWIHGSWSVPRSFSAALPFFMFAVLLVFCPHLYEDYSRGTREWFIACLLFTFASFVEYFLVICCGIKRTLRYTNGVLEGEHAATSKEGPETRFETRPVIVRNDSSVDVISRLLFPLLFVIFLAIYLLVQLL